jgi:thioredoxin-related protein
VKHILFDKHATQKNKTTHDRIRAFTENKDINKHQQQMLVSVNAKTETVCATMTCQKK